MRALRLVVVVVVVAACTHPPSPTQPSPTSVSPPPTASEITERTHEFLSAFDRGDVAAVEPQMSDRLVHFEGGKPRGRDDDLARLRKRKPGDSFIASRTWSDEHVSVSPDDAVFVGKATETQGGNEKHGGYRWEGWYTLTWVRDGDAWKVRLWTWQTAGSASARSMWNNIYDNGTGFEKQPNKLLVETVDGLTPGAALDLATGQGRNAIYLASRGWRTTGVDFADEGLQIARAEAKRRKLELSTINADIDKWDFGKDKWDLIAMIYPGDNHVEWIEKAKVALKPHGLFVLEFFAGDPANPKDGGYLPGQLAKLFADGFTILRDDTIEDTPDWAMDRAKLVRFVAKKN